jgi:hypothetical protein
MQTTGLTASLGVGTSNILVYLYGQSSSTAGAQFSLSFTGTASSVEWMQTANASGTTLTATSRQTSFGAAGTTSWTTANVECYAVLTGRIVVTAAGTIWVA